MLNRPALLAAHETLATARREVLAELDTERLGLLQQTEMPQNEELAQTLGAIVRQLDNAIHELGDAIRSCDQRNRIASRG